MLKDMKAWDIISDSSIGSIYKLSSHLSQCTGFLTQWWHPAQDKSTLALKPRSSFYSQPVFMTSVGGNPDMNKLQTEVHKNWKQIFLVPV